MVILLYLDTSPSNACFDKVIASNSRENLCSVYSRVDSPNVTKEDRSRDGEKQRQRAENEGEERKHNARCRTVGKGGTRTRGRRSGKGDVGGEKTRVLLFLTHIEQRLQHQSAIAPASPRDPRSAAQLPLQSELQCAATAQWQHNPTSATLCQQCNDITSEAQASLVLKAARWF